MKAIRGALPPGDFGASGKLTGYGGGLPLKKRLLELEGAWTMGLKL
jgi:hypothetical protein